MSRLHSQKGTVLLVALCFMTVLGISLASYIAVCSRTMQFSNRTFQNGVSQQLAELGLEEAMRAFNKNDWSDWSNGTAVDWTLDTTNKRATATITFPAGKFGQGATGTVKIRVDNYDVTQLDSTWATSRNYRVNDLVSDGGIWYRCIKSHASSSSNQPVNWNFWVPEGIPWTWDSSRTYSAEDLVVYNEIWYRCVSSNTNNPPPSANWQALVSIYTTAPAWPWVAAGQEALLFSGGTTLVQLTNATWGSNPPYQWRWRDAQSYKLNDVVYYNGVWYRSGSDHTSDWNNYPTGWATVWSTVTNMWSWSSSTAYSLNDVVYHSATSSWYRCIRAHPASQTPAASSAYWSSKPRLDMKWDSGRQYGSNDLAYYNGTWYLSIQSSNIGQNPSTATTYWVGTADSSYKWNSTTTYAANTYRSYDGVWYKSLGTTTGNFPNNASYWTPTWAQSSGVTTGAPVIYAEGSIALSGNPPLKTQLRATIALTPLLPNALAASTLVSIASTGTIDSYDASTDPTAANKGFSAVIAGANPSGTAVTISSGLVVNGYVATPAASSTPFAPQFSYNTGSTVVKGTVATPSPRVDVTRLSRSPFVPRFDVQPIVNPQTITLNFGGSSTRIFNLGTAGATTASAYNISGNLNIDSANDILYINGPVMLNITGKLGINSGRIIITNNGSLRLHFAGRMYVGTSTATTGIDNRTRDPQKCVIIGTSNYNSSGYHYFWPRLDYYGVLYMPDAYVHSGYSPNFYGAISAKNIYFNHAANVHYDTSLRYAAIAGVDQPYGITEWREVTDPAERITLP